MGTTFHTVTLESTTCCACGMAFAFPSDLMAQRREDHQTFCCPVGHWQAFVSESATQRAEKAAKRAQELLEQQRAETARQRELREAAERRLSATQGVVTRIKNRAAKGVCPCCTRSFTNLRRHMESQHPDYATTETTT